ncbi:MAG: hypothetical protein ACTHV2_15145 [Brachybacterium sp.]|uniref:hypothetical protein n=1 Tax=Brachybacterium paraconglomeratum TaxID=173362 RepID=UPI003FD56AB8
MFEVARTGVAPMICKDEHPDPWSDLVNLRSFRRPIQAATAMAAAALITLAGCGPVEDAPAPETETVEQGDSAAGDDPDAAANEDGTEAEEVQGSAERRALVFIHVVEPERLIEEGGEMRLPSADLAEIIQGLGGVAEEPSPGSDPASCENDLRYVASADVRCTVTAAFDGSERELAMYAHPIAAPGGAHGILYTADEPLTEDARWATFNGDNEATAIGMGGAYGVDPIPADYLVADMQTVIDFDFIHDPVDTTQWTFTVQDCPSALDFEQLAPVRCTATDDETGAEHIAWALPGTFYGQEPGLIVSIELVPAAE